MVDLSALQKINKLAIEHGIQRPASADDPRLLRMQRDTVARQWQTVNLEVETLSRTCLYCPFVAQSRASLKTHMRKHSFA